MKTVLFSLAVLLSASAFAQSASDTNTVRKDSVNATLQEQAVIAQDAYTTHLSLADAEFKSWENYYSNMSSHYFVQDASNNNWRSKRRNAKRQQKPVDEMEMP